MRKRAEFANDRIEAEIAFSKIAGGFVKALPLLLGVWVILVFGHNRRKYQTKRGAIRLNSSPLN
jgi:hypothetical protein